MEGESALEREKERTCATERDLFGKRIEKRQKKKKNLGSRGCLLGRLLLCSLLGLLEFLQRVLRKRLPPTDATRTESKVVKTQAATETVRQRSRQRKRNRK